MKRTTARALRATTTADSAPGNMYIITQNDFFLPSWHFLDKQLCVNIRTLFRAIPISFSSRGSFFEADFVKMIISLRIFGTKSLNN